MVSPTEESKIQYVLHETSFHEFEPANIVVENASGPLNPSGSFTLLGDLYLNRDRTELRITVNAKGPYFTLEGAPEKLTWDVKASLQINNELIQKKNISREHPFYLGMQGIRYDTIIGEATFELPPANIDNSYSLYLEGSYFANFGPYAFLASPQFPPIFGKRVYVRKVFKIDVEYIK